MGIVGRWSLLTFGKLLLLALAVVGGGSALLRDAKPAHASHTIIFLSNTSSCLQVNTTIFVYVASSPQNFYVCVWNIDNNPWGAAGFNLDMKYVSWLLSVNSVDLPSYAEVWLETTGRTSACQPLTIEPEGLGPGQGHVYGGCDTTGTNPPYGPVSNAAVGKIVLQGGIVKAATTLDMRGVVGQPTTGSHLVSAYWVPGDPLFPFGSVIIPATAILVQVYVAPCADYVPLPNGENFVGVQDILYLAQRFGRSPSSPPPPTWNPDWDMDGNNFVSVQDVLIGAKQFGRTCPA